MVSCVLQNVMHMKPSIVLALISTIQIVLHMWLPLAKKSLLAKTMDRLGLLQVNIMSVTQTRHENYQNKNVL